MSAIGPGCHELRVTDRERKWRIAYHLDTDAIVILEVFQKATRETPKRVVEDCRRRLASYRAAR